MGKTSTKRYFPALLLMLIGCLWGNSAWAEDLVIDFENEASTYSDWVFSNMTSKQTGSITAKGGTYYGTTGGTKTASITTANVLPYPTSITFYVSKQSTNTTASSWKIQVSADNKTWTNVKTQSATSMSKGEWVEVSQDLSEYHHVYVRVDYAGSTAVRNIDNLTLTYNTTATPKLTVSTTEMSFTEVEISSTKSSTLTVSAQGLSDNANLAISGTNAEMFSVSPASVTPADGSIVSKEVTVTYAPTDVGPHEATLTVSSDGAESKIIALSGTGIAPLAHYTVDWMVNGTAYTEGAPTTDVADGNKVTTLPTTPSAIGDKVFMGWTNVEIPTAQASAPSVLFTTAEEAPVVTDNVTYYAVYATQSGSEPTETLAQTLAYDTWTYGGSTTDKGSSSPSYRLFHTDGYVESASFDLSTLTKVVVYGGAFGGTSYNKLNIGDGTNTWKDVTVSGSKQDGVNTYTDGTPLSGTGVLRITSKSGSSSGTGSGVRISKIEIYTTEGGYTYSDYATTVAGNVLDERNLSFGETTAFDVYGSSSSFDAPALTGVTSGVTYTSSNEAVAKVDANTGTVTLQGVGTTTIKAAADKDENYLADEATYTLSVWPTSIAGIKQLITSTTATDFKAKLTDATVTYVNGNNAYLQDEDAAILIFLSGHGLTAGKSYTGYVTGQGMLYKGLREITKIDLSGTTSTDNTKEPEVVTLAQLNANFDAYESKYVKVVGVTTGTFTTSGNYQTTTLTQGTDELQLRAPSALTLIANNDYDFVGFPGIYNDTKQLNVWEESQITNQGKQDPNLAFAQESYTVEVDKTVTVAATNKSGASITYSVEDSNCSINASTGEFTATATGTYTVTATCAADESYIAGTATCQVVVTPPVTNLKPTVLYKKITSEEEFVDGGVYLIVCETKKDAMETIDVANDRVSSSNTITINEDKGFNYYDGEVNATGYPYEITITKASDGTYKLYHAEGKYIDGTNSTNLNFSNTGSAGWSITFVASTGNVEISHKDKSNSYIQRHQDAANNFYKNYADGQNKVQLYQKVNEMNIHARVKGYTTFVTDDAYVMPAGLTGKTVNVEAGGALKIDDAFQAGDAVPALTPLLIRTSEAYAADETMKSYYPAVTTKKVTVTDKNVTSLLANNNLEYYRTSEGMTSSKKLANPYYYKLSVDNEGKNPGFYWGAADGAAFVMKNGSTAYLACSVANEAAAAYFIDEYGEVTAIEGAPVAGQLTEDAVIYNLQGVRMNTKNLQRGIYIINGRKTVVK